MGAVRKLVTLDSLAVYFNTDSQSITESPRLLKAFRDSVRHRAERCYVIVTYTPQISQGGRELPDHQFILKPVMSEGRVRTGSASSLFGLHV